MAVLVWILALPFNTLFRGLVIHKVWTWHVVSVFAVKPLTVSEAISVSLAITALTARVDVGRLATLKRVRRGWRGTDPRWAGVGVFGLNLLILIWAWLVHAIQAP